MGRRATRLVQGNVHVGVPMKGMGAARCLAAVLEGLKKRSGLSYAELARRTYTTTSTLHRYCQGTSVPKDFTVLASFAQECGADAEQLEHILRLWKAAVAPSPQPEAPAPSASPEASVPGSGPHVTPEAGEPANRRDARPGRWRRRRLLVGCAGALAALGAAVFLGPGPRDNAEQHPVRLSPSSQPGEVWEQAPWPVSSSFFGVTLNSNTGVMPSFRVGAVRFWDGATRWANLQPRRTVFDWRRLDRLVTGAGKARLSTLFTLGGTPAWATDTDAPRSLYADGSRTTPPTSLRDWDIFIEALVRRYRGKIAAYELWDTATDPHFFSGSPATMAAMVRHAAHRIRSVDPQATVVCPSLGRLRDRNGSAFLRAFARLGGFAPCDVVAVKTTQDWTERPPETVVRDISATVEVLHRAGVGAPLWDTGPDYDIRDAPPVPPDRAAAYAARYYLTRLYLQELHLDRAYFYNWGGRRIPIVLQSEGSAPTAAALAVTRLQQWLTGAELSGCGHGAAAGLAPNVWVCRFTTRNTKTSMSVVWSAGERTQVQCGPSSASVRRLDGGTTALPRSGMLSVDGRPVMIASSRAPVTITRAR